MKLRSKRRKPEISLESLLPRFKEDGHLYDPPGRWSEAAVSIALKREMQQLIRDRIEDLPEIYRTVLLLRDIEGYNTAETAEILDVTTNAVKLRLHRARQALKRLLDPQFQGQSLQ